MLRTRYIFVPPVTPRTECPNEGGAMPLTFLPVCEAKPTREPLKHVTTVAVRLDGAEVWVRGTGLLLLSRSNTLSHLLLREVIYLKPDPLKPRLRPLQPLPNIRGDLLMRLVPRVLHDAVGRQVLGSSLRRIAGPQ